MPKNLLDKDSCGSGVQRPVAGGTRAVAVGASPVSRRRLLAALAEAEACLLTVISAPAGSGKTTLALQWLAHLRAAGNVAPWITLDANDNEPVHFVTRLARALQSALPEIAPTLEAVTGAALVDPDAVLSILLEELGQSEIDVFLFLDDFQVVHDPATIGIVRRLLQAAPRSFHLVLISRSPPPLPLAALRAGGAMFELDATALRFDLDEIDRLIATVQGRPARPEEVRELQDATDGWAIGVRILANSGRHTAASARPNLCASSPVLADYLDDMLAELPAGMRDFMVTTCFLDRLTAPLCDAVTGRGDSAELLEMLAGRYLLLTRLDDQRRWFRYHQLLADHLRQRPHTGPAEELRALHRRAYWWFAARSAWPEAIQHAIEAGDFDEARLWIEKCASGLVRRGDLLPLIGWHRALPRELLRQQAHVELAIAQALALAMRFSEARDILERLEAASGPGARSSVPVGCAVLRAMLAGLGDDSEMAGVLARAALPSAGTGWAANVLQNCVRFSAMGAGDLEAFHAVPLATMGSESEEDAAFTEVYRLSLQGLTEWRSLRAALAEEHLREAIAIAERYAGKHSAAVALPAGLLALALHESDRTAEAEDLLLRNLIAIRTTGMHETVIAAYTVLSRIAYDRDNFGRAVLLLEAGEALAHQRGWPRVTAAMLNERSRLAAASGDDPGLAGTCARLDALARDNPVSVPCSRSDIHRYRVLANARLALRRGDIADAILARLAAMREDAGSGHRQDFVLRADLLRAGMLYAVGEPAAGASLLQEAKGKAASGGMLRSALDEEAVIAASAAATSAAGQGEMAAVERQATQLLLAPRERAVLKLLADGYTNKEMARALAIGPETVKSHLKRIYGKLAVERRMQAVLKAQSLGLLPTS